MLIPKEIFSKEFCFLRFLKSMKKVNNKIMGNR